MMKQMENEPTLQDSAHQADPGEHPLLGYIDHADWYEISGWGFDPSHPETALWLEVVIDEGEALPLLANMHRQDLSDAGYGDGRFAFRLRFATPLDPKMAHSLTVRRCHDGRKLINAPILLARAPMASAEARAGFETAIAAEIANATTGPEVDVMVRFLLHQVDRLLQARAETRAGIADLQRYRLRWSDYLPGERAVPLAPDQRPWALVVDTELPETATGLNLVLALQAMGHRVAVVATRDLRTNDAVTAALVEMEVTVLGAPEHFTVEDVLRRHRGLYRAVVLRGVAASAYAVVSRQHQPRARIVAAPSDVARDRTDPLLTLGAALLADVMLVDTNEQAARIRGQLAGRSVLVLSPDDTTEVIASVLAEAGVAVARASRPPLPDVAALG